jgi:hypothetical protein
VWHLLWLFKYHLNLCSQLSILKHLPWLDRVSPSYRLICMQGLLELVTMVRFCWQGVRECSFFATAEIRRLGVVTSHLFTITHAFTFNDHTTICSLRLLLSYLFRLRRTVFYEFLVILPLRDTWIWWSRQVHAPVRIGSSYFGVNTYILQAWVSTASFSCPCTDDVTSPCNQTQKKITHTK